MKFCATFVNFLSTTFWFFIFARILMCRTSSIYIYFLPDLNLSGILKTRKSLEKGIDERFKTNLEVIVNSFWLISTNFLISKFYNYKLVSQNIFSHISFTSVIYHISVNIIYLASQFFFSSFFGAFKQTSNVIGWQDTSVLHAKRFSFLYVYFPVFCSCFFPYKTEADMSLLAFITGIMKKVSPLDMCNTK